MSTYLLTVFKSRTFWTLVGMFVIGGINNVVPFMDVQTQTIVNAVLSLVATYFHINPSQLYPPKKS